MQAILLDAIRTKDHTNTYNVKLNILGIKNNLECHFYKVHDDINVYKKCCFTKKAAAKFQSRMLKNDSFDAIVKVDPPMESRLYIRIIDIIGPIAHNVVHENPKQLITIDAKETFNMYSIAFAPPPSQST